MSKKIKFNYKGIPYTLEYTREALVALENEGLSLAELQNKPITMLPKLFEYAFYKNHRNTPLDLIDEIYSCMENKQALIGKLSEMASETVESLFEEPTAKNAIKWEAN